MSNPRHRRLYPLVWLTLLAIVGAALQTVIADHRARARGMPDEFPAPVAGADAPLLGVNATLTQYDDETLATILSRIEADGFTWVRQTFYWDQIESPAGNFDWSTADRVTTALARRPGLRLIAALDESAGAPPTDPDRFAAFAAAFAARYSAQIDVYQIWDEPNLAARWGGGPVNPPAYADLLARTTEAIRQADADAFILLAGLAPTVETGPQNLGDARYLARLYEAGAAPYFDAAAGKPYGFYTGPDDRRVDEGLLNFSRLVRLREVMIAHGDADKALWASHWGWNALPDGWEGPPSQWGSVDEATQAAHTVDALTRARTEWPWVGGMVLEHLQPAAPLDDARWGFALLAPDGAPRPVYEAASAWAKALPDAAPAGGYPAHNPWATYQGDWRVGPLGADVGKDGDTATFHFDGCAVALTVRRGPYRGFLYVTVDGAPANRLPRDGDGRAYVVLYDHEPGTATVTLAQNLPPGRHTVTVIAEGGAGQWSVLDWRVDSAPTMAQPARAGYVRQLVGLLGAGLALLTLLARDARRLDWEALKRQSLAWPEGVWIALVGGLTALFWLAAGASWGRDWASPWLIVSLFLSAGLTLLFTLRLDLGLATVALTAPFYLHPGEMFYGALSLPQTLIILCAIAWVIQRWGRLACTRRGLRRALTESAWIDRLVVGLLCAATLSALAASDRRAALFEMATVFFIPALYYALVRDRLRGTSLDAAWRLAGAFVLGGAGVAAIGLAQYARGAHVAVAEGGLPRLQSVYFSPNRVGLYLGRVLPLFLALTMKAKRRRGWMFYGLALGTATTALALTLSFSRGALLLGIPAALLAMGLAAGGRYRRAALTLVLIEALALIPLLRVPRFASLLDLQRGSAFFRLALWRSTLTLLRERPCFGVGPGNFLSAYRTRYVLPTAWQEFNLQHPHNIYLDLWASLGALGLLAGGALLIAMANTFVSALRDRRLDSPQAALLLGLLGSFAALLAHGLVDNALFFPDMAIVFFLTAALLLSTSRRSAQ